MSDVIYLKTGQFSNRSFNASRKELKKATDALNILDNHGAMSNTTYTCDGISRPIFSVDVINEASSIANLVNSLHEKLEAYSSLLQSGPDALRDADSSFKGEYTNAWQRGWYIISAGVSSVYVNTFDFWGSLFRKGGKKTGEKTSIIDPILPDLDDVPILTDSQKEAVADEYSKRGVFVPRERITEILDGDCTEAELRERLDKEYGEAEEIILARYNNGDRVDTSALDRKYVYKNSSGENVGYYVPGNGCTWYAAARYKQVNGPEHDLVFVSGGGNADHFDDNIDRTLFDVIDTRSDLNAPDGYNFDAIKCNAIAVSDVKIGGDGDFTSANHVAYIEAVIDGYVYYTEGAYPNPESTFGYMKRKPLDEFCKSFEHVISAK